MFQNISPRFHTCVTIFGDAWILLIIAALQGGDKRFGELSQQVPNINPATLSNRLKKLEAYQMVTRTKAANDKLAVTYSLTWAGRDMRPLLEEMSRFSDKYFQYTDGSGDSQSNA